MPQLGRATGRWCREMRGAAGLLRSTEQPNSEGPGPERGSVQAERPRTLAPSHSRARHGSRPAAFLAGWPSEHPAFCFTASATTWATTRHASARGGCAASDASHAKPRVPRGSPEGRGQPLARRPGVVKPAFAVTQQSRDLKPSLPNPGAHILDLQRRCLPV